jgi:methylphosphotriester-DNA--protein-cysteine methyltransferase
MKKENRVFFQSEEEAINEGYRPCAHCMNAEYQKWKGSRSATVQNYHHH